MAKIRPSSPAPTDREVEYEIQSPNRVFQSNVAYERFDMFEYLKTEMFGVGAPGQFEPILKNNVQNFLTVPLKLELLIALGFFMSLDSFLYVFTFLPMRVVYSLLSLFLFLQSSLLSLLTDSAYFSKPDSDWFAFHRTQGYDVMRGLLLAGGCGVLLCINMSQVYHFIRGQSFIKLYVLAGMMEVMDKLLSSFGQDTFDSLHRQTRQRPCSLQLLWLFLTTLVYVCLHATLYFFVIATLTVVINSSDEALITVLILNNFSEIRGFVFKKFDGNNMFQLACSDITERFQICLYLAMVFFVAMMQAGESSWDSFLSFLKVGAKLIGAEMVADGMKHAFITKFNSIKSTVYQDFAFVLRSDLLNNRKDSLILDHTYAVTRRLGLAQIPLGCVCIRYVLIAYTSSPISLTLFATPLSTRMLYLLLFYALLVVIKLVLGIGLLFYADNMQRKERRKFSKAMQEEGQEGRKERASGREMREMERQLRERIDFVEKLSEMDRYTVYNGRII